MERSPSATLLERFSPREKIALVFEILSAYVGMWRNLGRNDVLDMVAQARGGPAMERIPDPLEHQVARRLGKVVGKILGVLPTDSRCLIRSLVLVRILSRRAIPCILVIGVRKSSEFQAHAWVEHDGKAILPAGDYVRLTEL